jgi:U4/U6.U5 tri-snRNP-associated protein 2
LQGQLEVTTLAGTGVAADRQEDVVERKPFFMLSLDLPPARLFQDALDKDIIQQVREIIISPNFHPRHINAP